MQDLKIDLVYLWVDGNDEGWQKERNYWAKILNLEEEIKLNDCRFIDNQELKYSLRSVQMYAPWLNKIFIVTNGQIPKWLDPNHPKIKIIRHDEIMPKESLPTFNSEAIETCIANIPELSEYFLYSNDDKFFASKVLPEDFFDENNKPKVKMRKQNWGQDEIEKCLYKQSYKYTVETFNKHFLSNIDYKHYEPFHCIEAYRKSYFLECKKEFLQEFEATTYKKFRSKNSVQHPIVDIYMIECEGCSLFEEISVSNQDYADLVENLYLTLGKKSLMQKMILNKKPKLLCINDCEIVYDYHRQTLKGLLEELYPIKQDWEMEYINENEFINTEIQLIYAFNSSFVATFLLVLDELIKCNDTKLNYNLLILNTSLTTEDKKILNDKLPTNFKISFSNIENIINKSPYIEELRLTELLTQNKNNEKILFWGASLFLENFINKYYLTEKNICGIIDINPNRTGEFLGTYKIYKPGSLLELNPDKIIVSIINATTKRIEEIKEFLIKNHYRNIKIEKLY